MVSGKIEMFAPITMIKFILVAPTLVVTFKGTGSEGANAVCLTSFSKSLGMGEDRQKFNIVCKLHLS